MQHYIDRGAEELRDPSPFFNTGFYCETNLDVATSGVNPLLHYLKSGAAAGLAPNPWLAESAASTDRALLEAIDEKLASVRLSDLRP